MKIIHDALSSSICLDIGDYAYRLLKGIDLTNEEILAPSWTNFRWNEDIRQESAPVIVYPLPQKLRDKIIPELYELNLFKDETLETLASQLTLLAYVWTKGSWINWHNDGHAKQAITVYLNKDWEYNDGGLFIYQNEIDNEMHVIQPKFNTLVFNEGNVGHGTTPVTSSRQLRITLQGFIVRKNM